jgi:PAS domain S-box-containing protein
VKDSTQLFEELALSESPDALILMTPEGTILYWSRGAEAIFGYGRAQVLGHAIGELLIPTDRIAEEAQFLRETLEKGFATFESVRRRQNGALLYVDVSSRVVREPAGSVTFILHTEKDVTHLKVQRDAKLVEARYRDLLESTPDAIVMVNPSGHIVFVNGHAETLFGYERGALRGMAMELLLPERFRSAHVSHRSGYFGKPTTRTMGVGLVLYGLRKNGSEFPVDISLSPLALDESSLVMSAIRDITERKRIEQTLHEQNVELAGAIQAKDRFLATMSHELRTPLNAIIGFTGTLLMQLPGPLTSEQEKQLQTVQASGRHLLALINDLLDLAKIDAGKIELQLDPTECRQVIEEVASSLRPLAEGKGLSLSVALPGEEVVLRTDRRMLSQIVLNLVNNAIKFTERGAIRVFLLRRDSAGGRNVIEIGVHDTGSGIRPEDQAKLFAAFTQVDPTAQRRQEGTGLGLHLSQKFAEVLGGRIECRSEYGVGSTFTLRIVES